MKKCFKCGEVKPLTQFYKHKQMKDGHLNKCKLCARLDVSKHRLENIERIRAYDRARGSRQDYEYIKQYRAKYPNKYRAHNIVNNSIRDKRLFKEPCAVCGAEAAEAHHDDYLKPLNVRWLCPAHHKEWHVLNGEGENP